MEEVEEEGASEEGSTKTSEGSVGVEEGVVGMVREVLGEEEEGKKRKVRDERGRIAKEPENEFMLDGFDFSTSERKGNRVHILFLNHEICRICSSYSYLLLSLCT